ncbi:MAG: hypothetical protein GWP09_02815, partial [Nitrospiraceae bacterium]|nr:hypothetical protein [Nitrospiraceae bacterium]
MKILTLEAKAKNLKPFPKKYLKQLPNKITLLTTVQFLDITNETAEMLKKEGRTIYLPKMLHSYYPGQILGCSLNKIDNDSDTILFIGIGDFHPLALINNDKKVYVYNPFNQNLKRYDFREIKKKDAIRKKIILVKFINAKNIGIIISLKYGQFYKHIETKINLLKQKYPDKKYYY